MRDINLETEKIKQDIKRVLTESISTEYVDRILESTDENGENKLIDLIAQNVIETSAFEEENGFWNYDDIRLSIGRELMDRLNIN